MWSVSQHGPTEVLVERLRPMLIQYNVSAYFCGHEHDMQHIREWDNTVEYFVSGAGHGIKCSADNIVSEVYCFLYLPKFWAFVKSLKSPTGNEPM